MSAKNQTQENSIYSEEERITILEGACDSLLAWYRIHARQLPWRVQESRTNRPDPYHVWISEIMLQQTRVEVVKEYYLRFLKRLPSVLDLAEVQEDELMKLWQGLGYYNRARNLQRAARMIMEEYQGNFPEEYDQLLLLPGIGEYTAGAIASISFGKPVPAVDGNVYRIYTRLFGDASDITKTAVKRKIREQLLAVMPEEFPGSLNQAWMDLGAVVCIPNGEPHCGECPLAEDCLAKKENSWQSFPVKPLKKPRKQEERTVIVLECQGRYLIQKRPERGLLAGLWEFPSQPERLSLPGLQEVLQCWQIESPEIELLGKGEHIFSHVEWHMLGYLVHVTSLPTNRIPQEETVWASLSELRDKYSIPSAFRCYYEKLL